MKRYQQKSARRYRQEDQEIGVLRGGGTLQKKEQNDFSILGSLHHEKIVWEVCPSRKSTSIKNIYYTQDKERREVILDAQGVLRSLDEEGNLVFRDWEKKMELLPLVTYFKTDAAEAEILTGFSDRREAALLLNRWGAKEVMLTHNTEVMVCTEGEIFTAPYTHANNEGRTGRGDTTFATYLAWRMDHSVAESTAYAAALCSMKMEIPGPFKGTVEEVQDRMKRDASR